MSKKILTYGLALLAITLLVLVVRPLEIVSGAAQQECATFRETGKTVCGRFLQHWLARGGLSQHGFPISDELVEVSELNGRSYRVQYFERALFELHPENQPPNDVLLAQLGTLTYQRRYGMDAPSPTSQAPAPQTPTALPPTPTAVPVAPTAPPAAPATPSPAVAPPTIWINYQEYAERNGVTLVVFRADITRDRIDIHYLIENETAAPIPMSLSNADQLVADNDYNFYPPLEPGRVHSLVLQPNQNYQGTTSFSGGAYYNRAQFLTYGINNIPNLGNVRVRIPVPQKP